MTRPSVGWYFGIREVAKRKAGGQGSFIVDDDRKYPQKESLGPLSARQSPFPVRLPCLMTSCCGIATLADWTLLRASAGGIVGGFAGGEQGVQQFVEEGTIKLADRSRRQQSPLLIAGIVAAAGTLGGLLLYSVRTRPLFAAPFASLQLITGPCSSRRTKMMTGGCCT